ncbi:hypothetical protein K503DRAFT_802543 [Rhizopogon vinicolor AM-OR11-026]|uniref:F-box domain-containing protein n=1 Tax=Rhizopogon vinicolor AM-OR11-026 TaxID=1314800 RepID=A0A1B7MT42_9AGAM|nr:hypothetical protein K503DRAFT_802543 [Rhizopogon vinicolor AM-OR11-026]
MHICLLPTETLLEIFATINDSRLDSRVTIAALARTCQKFKEPALNILWKNTTGFKPLLSCLRPNAKLVKPYARVNSAKKRRVTLSTPLSLEEWNIVGQYARRIRSLTITSSINDIDERVVQALISTPTSAPLFLNLHRLEWWDDQERFLPLLRSLLVPTIRSMKLGSAPSLDAFSCHPWTPSFVKSALLASLGTRCPSIRELFCAYSDDSQAICEFVCGWQELLHLRMGVLNAQSLDHLASLPSLKSLHFRINDFGEAPHGNPTPTFTSQLTEVSITASAAIFTWCLRNVRFLSCQSVALHIDSDTELLSDSDDSMDTAASLPLNIPGLMDSFSECFSSAVEHITIGFGNSSGGRYEHDTRPIVFGFDAVVSLLPFSRLTRLDLNQFCTSAISDATLKLMTQSWPRLEEIRFGSTTRRPKIPSLTFIGLVHLIQHCRQLRDIEMSFCACSIDINCEPFSRTIPNEKITSIFVGISPIINPIAVAGQLHALMPNLTTVNVARMLSFPPPFGLYKDGWSRVDEFLVVLTEGAKIRAKIGQVSHEHQLPD